MSGRKRHRKIETFTTQGIVDELQRHGVHNTRYHGRDIEVREVDPTQENILICMRANTVFGPLLPPVPSTAERCSRCEARIWVSLAAPSGVRLICEVCFRRIGGR